MPVDEFGREIPKSTTSYATGYVASDGARRSHQSSSPSPPPDRMIPQQQQQQHRPYGNRGGGYHRSNNHPSDNHHRGGGGGYHNSPPPYATHSAKNHYMSAPVTSLLPTKPGEAAVSKGDSSMMDHTGPHYKSHPSFHYVTEPLLCGYVWKSSELATEAMKSTQLASETTTVKVANDGDDTAPPPEAIVDDDTSHNNAATTNENDVMDKLYEEYRKHYCLNYIRAFFNKHLDDSWFRQRFSPSVRKRTIYDAEQTRATLEAQKLASWIVTQPTESVWKDLRLGNGSKLQPPPTPGGGSISSPLSPRKSSTGSSSLEPGGNVQQPPPAVVNVPPLQHLFSFQQRTAGTLGLHVVDIPSHVTDEHIALALVDQYNTVIMAKHEQQVAEQLKGNNVDGAPDVGTSGPKSTAASATSAIPKKGAKNVVTIPPPTLLKVGEIKIYPAPATLLSDGPSSIVMHRQVFAIGPVDEFIEIVVSLKQRHDTKTAEAMPSAVPPQTAGGVPPHNKRLVPRKIGGFDSDVTLWNHPELFYGPFDLDVECSDPYGRLDYDADGRGGAPADGQTVQPRKSIVGISPVYTFVPAPTAPSNSSTSVNLATANLRKQQQQHTGPFSHNQHHLPQHPLATSIVVLSAALSSKTRLEQDQNSARTIARALDAKKRIPKGHRLQDIIQQHCSSDTSLEDILDLSIAYLRRVHLLSFYNGCTVAETIGDVMAGKHQSSTIHLRLQNADDYISQNNDAATVKKAESEEDPAVEIVKKEENAPKEEARKDMLVQRHDDSIAKALEYCSKWLVGDDNGDEGEHEIPGMVDERLEEESKEIEAIEEHVKGKWVGDHCIIDDDGRARCSFRFCHKLFRDSNFLEKHLLKKHCEFLRAEQAKCHDRYMMAAWDASVCRPVPPVLVDCGTHFGCVSASILSGQTEPDIVDPEPELWQRVQESRIREMEMKQKREELRQQQINNTHSYSHKERDGMGSPDEPPPPPRRSHFVDVDDMKEEKIELSFDAIEVDAVAIAALNKKKKKKRKLL